ncbi:hypothetical protein ACLOJK_040361 [Asimina triloba]
MITFPNLFKLHRNALTRFRPAYEPPEYRRVTKPRAFLALGVGGKDEEHSVKRQGIPISLSLPAQDSLRVFLSPVRCSPCQKAGNEAPPARPAPLPPSPPFPFFPGPASHWRLSSGLQVAFPSRLPAMGKRPPSPTSRRDIELGPHARVSHQTPYIPQPQRLWFPWLVPVFFLINVMAFVFTMYFNDCPSDAGASYCILSSTLGRFSFEPLSVNPLLGPSLQTLDDMGALDWKKVVHEGEGWRLMSCIWLHAGVIHLLANMLSLLFIGIRLEQEFGFLRIGLLYLLSGFGGSLASALSTQIHKSISVGASGALFVSVGTEFLDNLKNIWFNQGHLTIKFQFAHQQHVQEKYLERWQDATVKNAALLTLVIIIAINLAVGLVPHVDNSAHIGGFISGFLLGFILLIRPQFGYVSQKHIPPGYQMGLVKPKHKTYQYLLWIIAFVFLVAG